MRTIAVTESEPSFTLPSTPVCEWQSMMPGVTNLPVASMTRAFGSRAFTFGPTSAILPSRIRIEPLLIVPCEAVIMVAFLIRVSPEAGAGTPELAPAASFALPTVCVNAEATIARVSISDRIALVFFIIPSRPSRLADFGLRIRFQTPDRKFRIANWDFGLQTPDSRFQIPNFELLIHIESDCSEIRNLESGIWNLESGICNLKSEICNLKSQFEIRNALHLALVPVNSNEPIAPITIVPRIESPSMVPLIIASTDSPPMSTVAVNRI